MNTNNEKESRTKSDFNTSSNKDNSSSNASLLPSSSQSLRQASLSLADNNKLENVLILQGGGSLGAFGCGVFKALANNNIKLDIIAGTSIGGINAAIIAGSKDTKHPEHLLEQFWLELSESFVDLDKFTLRYSVSLLPKFVEGLLLPSTNYYSYFPTTSSSDQEKNYSSATRNANEHAIKMKQLRSFYSSAIFGIDKMFKPRWRK
jgi:NTE family protein